MEQFPESALLKLIYGNFLIDILKSNEVRAAPPVMVNQLDRLRRILRNHTSLCWLLAEGPQVH